MKNIRVSLSENFQFLQVKFSMYLNRHVFVMALPHGVINSKLCSVTVALPEHLL